MSLQKYWEKRDFRQTPEPRGEEVSSGDQLSYFIQRHHARRLHYDFRLELDGTLKSWAIPKGPSFDPHDKRLAVHVEDHPMDYGSFEGDIPAHQYGAGHVVLWDRGTWIPLEDPVQGYRKGMLKFRLEGIKLHGTWTLVRMAKRDEDKDNWLLIKEHDESALEGEAAQVTELRPESVKHYQEVPFSGRSTKSASHSRTSKGSRSSAHTQARKQASSPTQPLDTPVAALEARAVAPAKPRKRRTAAQPMPAEARKSAMPEQLQPQLATYVEQAPSGEGWLSEVKFDGYRALCRLQKGQAHLYSRNGNDWTAKWQSIADAVAGLPVDQVWLDGEVVAIDAEGKVSFQALQNWALHDADTRLAYYVFDLLYLDGYDLRPVPLIERKRLLESLLANLDTAGPVLYSSHIEGNAEEVFHHACMHSLEGIVVKRAEAEYQSTRSRAWLKVKCFHRQEFVIGGYTDPAGSREGFGALLLGVYDEQQQLRYAGRVGTGFNSHSLAALAKKMQPLQQKTPAFANPPTGQQARGVHWLKPQLVAEVTFAQWTEGGIIRHASFTALREDKPPQQIGREQALTPEEVDVEETHPETSKTIAKGRAVAKGKPSPAHDPVAAQTSKKKASQPTAQAVEQTHVDLPAGKDRASASIAGVAISNPGKVLFSRAGVTKRQLAEYYAAVADWLLPHLHDRPLTLVRCPNGGDAKCFFQKHVTDTTAAHIERITVPEDKGEAVYMMANDLDSVIGLVQMGALELHTWGSHLGALEKPDRIIFDLDPDEGLEWKWVTEAAQLVASVLGDIGLQSYVKTTGGKGLHVVAPIRPDYDWNVVKPFTRAIAEHLARELPERFTANMAKAKRTGRIFIDYLRNGSGATAVAAYSTRAKPDSAVSVPLAWDELGPDIRSNTFNTLNLPQRLKHLRQDPWQGYFKNQQRLTKKMLELFSA